MKGEEERHSSLELNIHGPTVRGWQSAKKCGYPQELILRLHGPAKLNRIQVLAHQYLIRKKSLLHYKKHLVFFLIDNLIAVTFMNNNYTLTTTKLLTILSRN